MGFMDSVREQAQAKHSTEQAAGHARAEVLQPCTGDHVKTVVNKGSIRMQSWESDLNKMYREGYRLAHVFSQDGNTIQVFEHHWH